jgi:hypothetical protein
MLLFACTEAVTPTARAPLGDRPVDTAPAESVVDSGEDVPIAEGFPCEPGASACDAGLSCCTACCLPDAVPVCTVPDEEGACPLPDLSVDPELLARDVAIETIAVAEGDCAWTEQCVDDLGDRVVVRFTTSTPNGGTADIILGDPEWNPDRFDWSECHQHYHAKDFAEYRVLDASGGTVLTGRKQAFCLMDTENDQGFGFPTYTCAYQGISVGWTDIYGGDLDCQWMDVTGLEAGDYTLAVELDPLDWIPEVDESDNTSTVAFSVP